MHECVTEVKGVIIHFTVSADRTSQMSCPHLNRKRPASAALLHFQTHKKRATARFHVVLWLRSADSQAALCFGDVYFVLVNTLSQDFFK